MRLTLGDKQCKNHRCYLWVTTRMIYWLLTRTRLTNVLLLAFTGDTLLDSQNVWLPLQEPQYCARCNHVFCWCTQAPSQDSPFFFSFASSFFLFLFFFSLSSFLSFFVGWRITNFGPICLFARPLPSSNAGSIWMFFCKFRLSRSNWRGKKRGCASAVLRDCNMIELVHAKLTHTYAATRRPSGMHVGRASVSLSVFQICLSLLKKGRVLDSPVNM